jgi:hypothetical protein
MGGVRHHGDLVAAMNRMTANLGTTAGLATAIAGGDLAVEASSADADSSCDPADTFEAAWVASATTARSRASIV